jgi:hypothetical protein
MLAKYRLPQNRRFKVIKTVLDNMEQGQRTPFINGIMFQRDEHGLFIEQRNPQRGVAHGIEELSLPPFEEVELYDEQSVSIQLWQGEYRYLDWDAYVEYIHRQIERRSSSVYVIRIYASTLEQALAIHRQILKGEVTPTYSRFEAPTWIQQKLADDLAQDLLS